MKFYPISVGNDYYIQIEAAGIGSDIVDNLLSSQGSFLAKVSKPVKLSAGSGTMLIGENSYPVSVSNDTVFVNNQPVGSNGTFVVENITFELGNRTVDSVVFLAHVYTGKDIELVKTDPQSSGIVAASGGYQFYFVVLVSTPGAERFSKVTAGIPKFVDIQSGEEYIDSRIYLYLDDKLVSDLRISSELAGKVYQTPQVQGFRQTLDEATSEMMLLQTVLRSGALPARLETASIDVISPTLGGDFFTSAIYAALLAAGIVVSIVFIRYRSLKIALPISVISMSEVVIMLGIAAYNDTYIWLSVMAVNAAIVSFAWVKKQEVDMLAWIAAFLVPVIGMLSWTIDLPAIGGMIATLGTGIDQQIIIADESLRGSRDRAVFTMKEKIKRAFAIVFGAAATLIAAMLPLMFLGIGLVKGFAITTIAGVLVGVLVARPAYARIVELTSVVKTERKPVPAPEPAKPVAVQENKQPEPTV
jgi:preprotein translocase subunit SecD